MNPPSGIRNPQFAVVGLSHRTAPVGIRERLALPPSALAEAIRQLKSVKGVQEGVILSTCNRVEVYAYRESSGQGIDPLEHFFGKLASRQNLPSRSPGSGMRIKKNPASRHPSPVLDQSVKPYLYAHDGPEALRHAVRVGAGLEAMVLGETQVFGQLKEAFFSASTERGTGPVLNGLFPRIFNVVKRVHAETGIGQMPGSVSSVAVDLAEKIFGSLSGKSILIIGAGKMSELTARSLSSRGVTQVIVVNRTFDHALELARQVGGTAVPFEQLGAQLIRADIVISSITAASWVLRRGELEALMPQRRYKSLFLIDIAIPRNIDPGAADVEGVYLYNIDDLQGIADRYLRERQRFVGRAEDIVTEGVQELSAWMAGLAVSPMIADLHRLGEAVRQEELGKAIRRLPAMSEVQYEELERFSKAIVSRLLKGPVTQLKSGGQIGRPDEVIQVIREMFTQELMANGSNGHPAATKSSGKTS